MAAAGASTTAVDYDSFLALLTEQSRQNFLTACRVILDNAAQALREVCEREYRDYNLPIPTSDLLGNKDLSLPNIEFCSLAKYLCDGERRAEKFSGSFFVYLFEAEWVADKGGYSFLKVLLQQKRKAVDVDLFDWSQLERKVYTHSQVSFMERVTDRSNGNLFRLLRPRDKKHKKTVHVYLTEPRWAAVDKLREQRNKYIGHTSSAALHTSDLVTLFQEVKKCYRSLDVSKDIYKLLEKIEKEHKCKLMQPAEAEEISEGLLRYRQMVMNEWTVMDQRLDKLEEEVAALKMHVDEEIDEIKEDMTGLRESQTKQTEGGLSVKSSATMESSKDKNERAKDVFIKHYRRLLEAIGDPLVLAAKLKSEGYIDKSVVRNMESTSGVSNDAKSIKLLNAVEALLGVHDDAYTQLETLMSIFEVEGGALKVVINSMRTMLKEE